ncbi:hypothetical protein POM88_005451 [Heracleum sosnowskyi]|uniref:Uncharacterized protein n=1 Tax=Heracleum sosnowskyi TaxID=360622 RepID=A0AAD8J1Z9_9APIA|nr:hypothetical protein POM88_005451 [Heracleum sosnowskyi]
MSFEDFSLPEMVISKDDHDLEFKFCCIMEPGASSDAPADHLFSNGRLVPHDFPSSSSKSLNLASRSTSWGSSKDGSEFSSSSRSNSCSSSQRSSSSSSSSLTSTSGAISERRVLIRARRPRSSAIKRAPETYKAHKHVSTPEHGSRKWQFIAAAPVLNGNVLHKSVKITGRSKAESADQKVSKNKKEGRSNRCWRRFLCLLVSACNEFHAIESSTIEC